MKIGILTPFDNRNFGNRLQNYALQQILKRYADEVITIKNKPANPSLADRLRRHSALAESVLLNDLLGQHRKARILQFNRTHLKISRNGYWFNKACSALKPADRCHRYCAGSDQVWNPDLGRTGMFSYLGFASSGTTFSYAASFGVDRIPASQKDAVRKGLRHIRYLSVREDAGKRIVEELTGRTDVEVLVDPTLLLTPEEWDAAVKKPKAELPESYLLTYFLGTVSPERSAAISRRAAELGCRVIALMDPKSPFYAIGPGEFLYLIQKAALVCTDSFHGSVFSFLYGKPLVIFRREGEDCRMGSRLETLAARLHLETCMAKGDRLPPTEQSPDYSAGYKALELERSRADAFLRKALSP